MSDELVRRGTNLPRVGDFNQTVIIDLIRRSSDGTSRVELARATGLSGQTVSNITRRLIEANLVVEGARMGSGPGKPRTLLKINPDGHFALGVHIDPAAVTVVMLNFVGEVAEHEEISADGLESVPAAVHAIAATVEAVIGRSGVPREKVIGLGLAVPGPVDVGAGVVVDPPHLAGWHEVEIQRLVESVTSFSVSMQKYVVAAATGESWVRGDHHDQSFAFIYIGTGVGAGLVLDGTVIAGRTGNAGEIGHLIVDEDGPQCWCGSRGCFGVSCMAASLVAEAAELGVIAPAGSSPARVDAAFAAMVEAVTGGDVRALAIVERASIRFARAALDLANLLDVSTIVFGGLYWGRLENAYLPRVQSRVEESRTRRDGHAVKVLSTVAGTDVAAVGAACLVLDEAFSPRTANLPFRD